MICMECESEIQKDEGFIPNRFGKYGFGRHHPNCKNPAKPHQVKTYVHSDPVRLQSMQERLEKQGLKKQDE